MSSGPICVIELVDSSVEVEAELIGCMCGALGFVPGEGLGVGVAIWCTWAGDGPANGLGDGLGNGEGPGIWCP